MKTGHGDENSFVHMFKTSKCENPPGREMKNFCLLYSKKESRHLWNMAVQSICTKKYICVKIICEEKV